jgi:hypothetical protein
MMQADSMTSGILPYMKNLPNSKKGWSNGLKAQGCGRNIKVKTACSEQTQQSVSAAGSRKS